MDTVLGMFSSKPNSLKFGTARYPFWSVCVKRLLLPFLLKLNRHTQTHTDTFCKGYQNPH